MGVLNQLHFQLTTPSFSYPELRLGKFEKLMRTRHQFFEYPVWVAYHPAYLLRQPQLSPHSPKWETWQILCRIKLYLEGLRLESSDK